MTDETRLSPGDPAPLFVLPDQDDEPVALEELRGSRVILYFYPQAMTPGCTTQACDFRDSFSSLQGAGYTMLGVSRDLPAALREFRERDGLGFELLSDPDHRVHTEYGVWGDKVNYGKVVQGVIRSTFVIDEEGRIEHALYNVKATGHVARLRTMLGIDAA